MATQRDELHVRNRHNGQYDFEKLISCYPDLRGFVAPNKYGTLSINFFDPAAVKSLNKALLFCYYGMEYWDIPVDSLCPPIPGRADYIHYVSDLIGCTTPNSTVRCLDVGVGANAIFPIIGVREYDWSFVATDINAASLANARKIVDNNAMLNKRVELRLQHDSGSFFNGVVRADEFFDLTVCNPPFHDSPSAANKGTLRKLSNLKGERTLDLSLNFGGQDNELWCKGGELRFISGMIQESSQYGKSVGWFTVLVSKRDNLDKLCRVLKRVGVADSKIISMHQGNKSSRILAWKY